MKLKKTMLLIATSILTATSLISCNSYSGTVDDESIRSVYNDALKSGYQGTYEEWLKSISGQDGKDGREITEIIKTGEKDGNALYTVKFSDGTTTTLEIPLPKDGEKGDKGEAGVSIKSVVLTHTEGNVDTYTITYTDGTTSTFTVTNGEDGKQGIQGEKGQDGHTPEIRVGYNGNWWIDGVDSGCPARGKDGEKGEQGEPGNDGQSAYQLYIASHPDYHKSESEWLDDLINNRLGVQDTCVITFEYEDHSIYDHQAVIKGHNVVRPEDPTKEGLKFVGWYCGDVKWFFEGYSVSYDITLTARFENAPFVVTLDPNGGYLKETSIYVEYGSHFQLPVPTSPDGLSFVGYYDGETQLTDNMGASVSKFTYSKDITAVAKYESGSEPVDITLWHYEGGPKGSVKKLLDAMVSNFNLKNPNIKLTAQQINGTIDDAHKQLVQSFSAGTEPDMFVGQLTSLPEIYKYGKVVNLMDYFANPLTGYTQTEMQDFVKPVFTPHTSIKGIEQGIFSIPFKSTTDVMYYREDVLSKITLDYMKEGQTIDQKYLDSLTWEELFDKLVPGLEAYDNKQDDLHKIIAKNPGEWGFVGLDSTMKFFMDQVTQKGSTLIDEQDGSPIFNTADNKKIAKNIQTLASNKHIITKDTGGAYMSELLNKGSALFNIGSANGYTYYNSDSTHKIGVCPVPTFAGSSHMQMLNNTGLSIVKSNNPSKMNASWKFMKFFLEKENQEAWCTHENIVTVPTRYSILTSPIYLDKCNEERPGMTEQEILHARILNIISKSIDNSYYTPVIYGGNTNIIMKVLKSLMYQILTLPTSETLDQDIETMFKKATDQCMVEIEQN